MIQPRTSLGGKKAKRQLLGSLGLHIPLAPVPGGAAPSPKSEPKEEKAGQNDKEGDKTRKNRREYGGEMKTAAMAAAIETSSLSEKKKN